MRFEYVFLLSSLISLSTACDWLDAMKEKKMLIEIKGEGLHRHMAGSLSISSTNRFMECYLLYQIDIPAGGYVDMDSVNNSLSSHYFYSTHRFDVEAPAEKSKNHKVLLRAKEPVRKGFIIQDSFNLPIHIRYHAVKEGASVAFINFGTPVVLLDCPLDYKAYNITACSGKKSFAKYDVHSQSPYWIAIEPTDKRLVNVTIPIGAYDKLFAVIYSTGFVILSILAYILIGKLGTRKEIKEQ